MSGGQLTQAEIRERAAALGDWFHNIDLEGVPTAPNHFLHDYPNVKWKRFAHAIPEDLTGKSVLDIGCNGGFYSLEMKRRGAERVLGIDFDDRYLDQARFAAEVKGADIEFRKLSVYDLAQLGERFDVVLFMGVLYHLRHPLHQRDPQRNRVRVRSGVPRRRLRCDAQLHQWRNLQQNHRNVRLPPGIRRRALRMRSLSRTELHQRGPLQHQHG